MAQRSNRLGWTRYYAGRSMELLGLVLVMTGLMRNFSSETLWPLFNFTVAGVPAFMLGWLLARKNPEA